MKTKVFAIFALLLCTTMFFTGCSEDDDNGSLNGTTWIGYEYDSSGELDYNESVSITFQETTFTFTSYEDGELKESFTGSYEYTPPTVALTVEGGTMYATISSNILYWNDVVFTKQ